MNFAHYHLLLNHVPIIGTIIGLSLYAISFLGRGKNEDLRRSGLIIFVATAFLAIPVFVSGIGAQQMIKKTVPEAVIQRHEGSAMLSVWFVLLTGAFAAIGLWQTHRTSRQAGWNAIAVLLLAVLAMGFIARTGNTGGDILHPEIRRGQEATVTEGPLGSFLRHFEPAPEKFTTLMVINKWWWAGMMDLHFIGLALLMGTVGILDLRIMGFAKQIPIAAFHRFLPWGMTGLGINVLTGMLAFIGMPTYYTFDLAFELKVAFLMLAGANVALFYLTGAFRECEAAGPGANARPLGKILAATSLVIWIAVIVLGRYIQTYENTIDH
jgi:hypothetical protein